jgi:hypothetical protein
MNFILRYFPPPAAHHPHVCIARAALSGNTCFALPPSLAQLALSLSSARARSDETKSLRRAVDCSLSPLAGSRGEGTSPQARTRGEAPSPGAQARADLSPQAGRGKEAAASISSESALIPRPSAFDDGPMTSPRSSAAGRPTRRHVTGRCVVERWKAHMPSDPDIWWWPPTIGTELARPISRG